MSSQHSLVRVAQKQRAIDEAKSVADANPVEIEAPLGAQTKP